MFTAFFCAPDAEPTNATTTIAAEHGGATHEQRDASETNLHTVLPLSSSCSRY